MGDDISRNRDRPIIRHDRLTSKLRIQMWIMGAVSVVAFGLAAIQAVRGVLHLLFGW
jgi:hypothetical protein